MNTQQQVSNEWPCPYCEHAPFNDHRARNNHVRFDHPGQPIPKLSKEEARQRKILKLRLWRANHPKRTTTDRRNAPPSPETRLKIGRGIKAAWRKKKALQVNNGVLSAPLAQTDNLGESARAIIMAASVLRAVSLGLKL